jgi:hypothetical protein
MTDTLTLTGPEAYAASIPALVGFYPHESLVVTYLDQKRIIVSMRMDLPGSEIMEQVDYAAKAPLYVAETAKKVGADAAIVAVITDHTIPSYHALAVRIEEALAAVGCATRDALLIRNNRWRSLTCPDTSCCPPEGKPVPDDKTVEFERVLNGEPAVAANRDEVVARYTPRPDLAPHRDVMMEARAVFDIEPSVRARQAWEAVKTLVQNREHPGPEWDPLRATLILAVQHILVRDYVMCRIAASNDYIELIDMVVQVAITAPEGERKQICAMAAALMPGLPSAVGVEAVADLGEGESMADMAKMAAHAGLPPQAYLETMVTTMDKTDARLVVADKEFRKGKNADPLARELRKRR